MSATRASCLWPRACGFSTASRKGTEMETAANEIKIKMQIDAILAKRRERLPGVRRRAEQWSDLLVSLRELDGALAGLHGLPDLELTGTLAHSDRIAAIQAEVAALEASEMRTAARFGRDQVNIGVAGAARVGKSTLLQTITGLTDQEIPTGSGLPVTAARSRIAHTQSGQRAIVSFHSFASFAAEVLSPYHRVLELGPVPTSWAEFISHPYPKERQGGGGLDTGSTLLKRLLGMQRPEEPYGHLLVGGDHEIALNEVRSYISYPASSDPVAGGKYLAVREVRIETAFPHAAVHKIGIIDLPGLGEVAAEAEGRLVQGLQSEVDVALIVVRPTTSKAYWDDVAAGVTAMLDDARKPIRSQSDFVLIVINDDGTATEHVETFRKSIAANNLNSDHTILAANVSDHDSVANKVVLPVLQHLVERLGAMDDEVHADVRERGETCLAAISRLVQEIRSILSTLRSLHPSDLERLEEEINRLQQACAANLGQRVSDLEQRLHDGEELPGYVSEIEQIYTDIIGWIDGGFGKGDDEWCSDRLADMRVAASSLPVAINELNSIRVEISERLCRIDGLFKRQTDDILREVASDLRPLFDRLMTEVDGRAALGELAQHAASASEPCPHIERSINDLLSLRLEYRANLHPVVRSHLAPLRPRASDPADLVLESRSEVEDLNVRPDQDGARQLLRVIKSRSKGAAYQVRKQLLSESVLPLRAIHAAVEHFEDVLIRGGDSKREFRRIGRSYRDTIWPGKFGQADTSSAHVARVARALSAIDDAMKEMH